MLVTASEPTSDFGRSVSSSEWSDPQDERKGASQETPMEETGIKIPSFLQPLLGMDFVPYLPSQSAGRSHAESSSSGGEDLSPDNGLYMAEHDDEELEDDLVDHVCGSHHDDDDDDELDLRVALEFPSTTGTPLRKVSRKKKIKNAIGRTIRKIKDKKARRRSSAGTSVSTSLRLGESSQHSSSREDSARSAAFKDEEVPVRQISPSNAQIWMQEQHLALVEHQRRLSQIQAESQQAKQKAEKIERRIGAVRQEAYQLQQALERSMTKLRTEMSRLETTVSDLDRLEDEAVVAADSMEDLMHELRNGLFELQSDTSNSTPRTRSHTEDLGRKKKKPSYTPQTSFDTFLSENCVASDHGLSPNRPRANTEPRPFRRTRSGSFMRVSDLTGQQATATTRSICSPTSLATPQEEAALCDANFFSIDENVGLVLDQLYLLGWDVATDESDRFKPLHDTKRILQKNGCPATEAGWPVESWNGAKSEDVLIWTGGVPHKGFGHDWPVVKARGVVHAPARELLDFLLDSSQLKNYNKMSQGRYDLLVLQKGVDTLAEESPYGFAGEARIMRALNKPKLLPKTIEVLSLWDAKPLENVPGSYMIVNRSVWENESGTPSENGMLRSEMLLGVFLVRQLEGDRSELTTITHVYSPGVPEVLAKRMAPSNAAGMLREIQGLFPRC